MHGYRQDWKLNVNLNKTNAVVFSNKLRKNGTSSFTFKKKGWKLFHNSRTLE